MIRTEGRVMPDTQSTTAASVSRRRAQTRDRLLTAARETFGERGFYGATVEDICEAAGFTRGAFYSNFASKDDLFFALHEREKDQRMGSIQQVFTQEFPAGLAGDDLMDELIRRVIATQPIDRHWYLIDTEFSLHAVRDPAVAQRLNQARLDLNESIRDLIVTGLALTRRRLTIDPDDASSAMLAVYEQGVRETLMADPGASAAALPGLALRTWPRLIRAFTEPIPDED
jgi:AcrR family transcriptional regulator